MDDVSQLASAMLAVTFAAVMLVMGQLYIEDKSAKLIAASSARRGQLGHVHRRPGADAGSDWRRLSS
jgi:hypothetical protein